MMASTDHDAWLQVQGASSLQRQVPGEGLGAEGCGRARCDWATDRAAAKAAIVRSSGETKLLTSLPTHMCHGSQDTIK